MATFSVEEVSPIQRRLRAEVEPEAVAVHLQSAFRRIARGVQMPGFRKGKVPRRIIEARFKGEALGEAIQDAVTEAYGEALDKNPQLQPVAPPEVELGEYTEGKPYTFTALIDVRPQVTPSRLEGLELSPLKTEVTEADVDAEIEQFRQRTARLMPVEGRAAVEKGDYAVVDFDATIDGEPFPGSKTQDATFHVEDGELVAGKMPELVGVAIGETKEVDYTFPSGHSVERLAGKQAHFTVTVKGLKAMSKPPLDDAFAQSLGDFPTLAAFRQRVETDLVAKKKQEAERERKQEILKQLLERNPFDVPRSLVERTMDDRIRDILSRLQAQGLDPSQARIDFDKLRESLREGATRDLKAGFLLDAIADQQKIEVEEGDIDAKVLEILASVGLTPDHAARHFGDSERATLRGQLREEKTVAFLVSKANIAAP